MTAYRVIQGGQDKSSGDRGINTAPQRQRPRSVNFATVLSEANALVASDLAKLRESAPVGDNCLPQQSYIEFNEGMLLGTAIKALVRHYEENNVTIQHKGYIMTYADMHLQHVRDLVSDGFGGLSMKAGIETTFTDLDKKRQAEGIEQTVGGGGFQVSGGCSFAQDLASDGGMAIVYGTAQSTAQGLEYLRNVQGKYEDQFFDMFSGRNPEYTQIRQRAQKQPKTITLEEVFRVCPVQYTVPRGSNDIYEVDVEKTMRDIMAEFSYLVDLHDQARAELTRLAKDPEYRQALAKMRAEELLGVQSGTMPLPEADTAPDEF